MKFKKMNISNQFYISESGRIFTISTWLRHVHCTRISISVIWDFLFQFHCFDFRNKISLV